RQVAVDKSEDGDRNEQSAHLRQNQKWLEHAQKNDKPGGFRTDRQVRCHRGRRALINIRYPDMKRDGSDFEAECDNDRSEEHTSGVVLKAGPRKYRRNLLEIR